MFVVGDGKDESLHPFRVVAFDSDEHVLVFLDHVVSEPGGLSAFFPANDKHVGRYFFSL